MAKIVKGVWDCTAIRFHPMIPLNPSSDEAVYSTMVFVLHHAGKLNMCCAALTFDQPLYLRAYRIKEENRRVPKLDLAGWWFPSVDVIPWNRMQADGRKRKICGQLPMPETHSPKLWKESVHKDLACLPTDRCCSTLSVAANDTRRPTTKDE